LLFVHQSLPLLDKQRTISRTKVLCDASNTQILYHSSLKYPKKQLLLLTLLSLLTIVTKDSKNDNLKRRKGCCLLFHACHAHPVSLYCPSAPSQAICLKLPVLLTENISTQSSNLSSRRFSRNCFGTFTFPIQKLF